ncbi:MAG: hypothetical protein LQ340_006434 [Diploschistes diacapsis]|nr:MAG: hypothetical protein LQ340_006434 [Diploschistes diacapsis]
MADTQHADPAPSTTAQMRVEAALPRVVITFCTQCRWMLRAAYVRDATKRGRSVHPFLPFPRSIARIRSLPRRLTAPRGAPQYAQELLSTFALALGEVSLRPATGGVFAVELVRAGTPSSDPASAQARASNQDSASEPASDGGVEKVLIWDRKRDGGFPAEDRKGKRKRRETGEDLEFDLAREELSPCFFREKDALPADQPQTTETKTLKKLVRDIIAPGRDLGHVDRVHGSSAGGAAAAVGQEPATATAAATDAETGAGTGTDTTTDKELDNRPEPTPTTGGGKKVDGEKCEECA